ncbi:hypothetical protein Gotur_026568 [Gossypium turneri]
MWVRNMAWKMTYFCPHGQRHRRMSQPFVTHGQGCYMITLWSIAHA